MDPGEWFAVRTQHEVREGLPLDRLEGRCILARLFKYPFSMCGIRYHDTGQFKWLSNDETFNFIVVTNTSMRVPPTLSPRHALAPGGKHPLYPHTPPTVVLLASPSAASAGEGMPGGAQPPLVSEGPCGTSCMLSRRCLGPSRCRHTLRAKTTRGWRRGGGRHARGRRAE